MHVISSIAAPLRGLRSNLTHCQSRAARVLSVAVRCNATCVPKFKADVESGQVKFGVFVNSCSFLVAEQLSCSGYDWVLVDQQHSPASYETLGAMLAGIANGGAMPWVRVAGPDDRIGCQQALDMGAKGVMVPSVVSREETQRAVEYCMLPQQGVRSIFYPIRSAPPTTGLAQYLATANENVYIAVQVETVSALDRLDDILSVPHIDCAFVGPVDLCYSLGLHKKYSFNDMFNSPEMQEATGHVLATCQSKGITPGNFAFPSSTAPALATAGFRVLAVASDLGLLADASKQQLHALKDGETTSNG